MISLNLILLLQPLPNSWVGPCLELIYLSFIVSKCFSYACAAAIVYRNHFFRLHQQNKSSMSKTRLRQASNRWKRVSEAAKCACANKTKYPITFQKLGSYELWRIFNSDISKVKSTIHPVFNGRVVLPYAFDAAQLFAGIFSKNSNLDDSCVNLWQ